jgi:Domain of unknown function (DUF4386)
MTVSTVDAVVRPVDASQRRAARAVGCLYLVGMATGILAQTLAPGNFADGARDIVANARLLRLGAAIDVLNTASDTALIVAFFVLLRPVGRNLAALGAAWRLAQVAITASFALTNVVVLQLLSDADEVRALTTDQAAALAWVASSAHTTGYGIGWVFAGLGSTVFAFLLFKSRYVPQPLAAWGIFSSVLWVVGSLVMIIFPEAGSAANPGLFVPMFIFEVTTGLWLLIKGVRSGS